MTAVVEPEVATYQQYIDGVWAGAEDGRTYGVINPSTEEVMALAPPSTRPDPPPAVAAARRSVGPAAQDGGGPRTPRHRVVPEHGRAGAERALVRAAAQDQFAIRVLELRAAR